MIAVYIIVAVLAFIVIFEYILILDLHNKQKRQKRRYDRLLRGIGDEVELEEVLLALNKSINEVEKKLNIVEDDLVEQNDKTIESFTKTGIFHYNAYEGQRGNLSFSLCLLDNFNNGIVLTSLYGQEGSNIFLKEVKRGQIMQNASPEEVESVELAIEGRK